MAAPIGPRGPILCPAGTWTTVAFGSLVAGSYSFTPNVSGVTVMWRRFTSSPPFFWTGTFVSGPGTFFFFAPWHYVELQFNPAAPIVYTSP